METDATVLFWCDFFVEMNFITKFKMYKKIQKHLKLKISKV